MNITRYGGVRSPERVREIMEEAEKSQGFVVHTLVSAELRQIVFAEGRHRGIATIDLMGPLLARLTALLATVPRSEPGLFRPFDEAYLSRVEAIRFTVDHDDGRRINELSRADIVLVGVSRTCKTPTSMYLATQGWRVANVPLVLGIEPSPQLFALPRRRVVILIVQPTRLATLRRTRVQRIGAAIPGYADPDHVQKEIAFTYELRRRRPDWPVVDMTAKPVEEAAAEIVNLVKLRDGKPAAAPI